MPQVHHVWGLLARKADVYYPHSAALVPWLVQALSRLSQTPVSVETRRPIADLTEMLILWERRRSAESDSRPEVTKMETDSDAAKTDGAKADPAKTDVSRVVQPMLPRHQEIVLMFLTHTACQSADLQNGAGLAQRCLSLLEDALRDPAWVGTNINVGRFDKVLSTMPSDPAQALGNHYMALRVLALLFTHLPRDVAVAKAAQLRAGLAAALQCRIPRITTVVCDLLKLLVGLYPINTIADRTAAPELDALYRGLRTGLEDAVGQFERGTATSNMTQSLQASLAQLTAIAAMEPAFMVEVAPTLMKILQKVNKDLVPTAPIAPTTPPPQTTLSDETVKLVAVCLDLLAPHPTALDPTLRKTLLTSIGNFLDKTSSTTLLQSIVSLVAAWMPLPDSVLPFRDRMVLSRLVNAYGKRFAKDPSLTAFLTMVLAAFRDPAQANSEITVRLEPGFLMGLRAADGTLRESFFRVFDQGNAGAGLFNRLEWCLSDRTCKWDSARSTFWLKHVLDVVLSGGGSASPIPPCAAALPPLQLRRGTVALSLSSHAAGLLAADREWFATKAGAAAEFVASLRSLCHVQPQLAFDLWVLLFPQVW